MKWNAYIILWSISIFLFNGCHTEQRKTILEQQIIAKIRQDTPYLAHLEATYSIAYINYTHNRIFTDDVYVRNDDASVFYGYALKDADIAIMTENNERILRVKLPQPKQISIDRKVVSIETNDPEYRPIDASGQRVDVDAYMNQQVEKALKTYEEKTIEMTREMSRQYFEAVAHRFGLKLQLEFITALEVPKKTTEENQANNP